MMRKPAVIVGLILIPLVTTSALVVHLTNSSQASGAAGDPTSVSTTQELDQSSHESSGSAESESSAISQSGAEGSSGTNNSKEPAPRSESSKGDAEDAASEPSSEIMLAGSTADQQSSHSLASAPRFANSAYGAASTFSALRQPGAVSGRAAAANTSSGADAASSDVKNTSLDSLPAQEQNADAAGDEGSDAVLAQTGETQEPSAPHFPSETQSEESSEQVVDDVPALVSVSGPTPRDYFDEKWPKQEARAPVQVPEPSSLVLLGLGLIGIAVASRKRQ